MLPFCFANIEFADLSLGKKSCSVSLSSALFLFIVPSCGLCLWLWLLLPLNEPSILVPERGACWWWFGVWMAEHLSACVQVRGTLESRLSSKTNRKKNVCRLQVTAWELDLRGFCFQNNKEATKTTKISKEMWVPYASGTMWRAGQSISGKFLHLRNGFWICWPKWVYYILSLGSSICQSLTWYPQWSLHIVVKLSSNMLYIKYITHPMRNEIYFATSVLPSSIPPNLTVMTF